MNTTEGQDYARHRGRVRNRSTSATANLVEWTRGIYCKVFTGYEWIGNWQSPIFARWLKADTEQESNAIPIGPAK
jgi:hypothetical protein